MSVSLERLKYLYAHQLTTAEIATKVGMSDRGVAKALRRAGVVLRCGGSNSGQEHHNWRGGITPLYKAIRQLPEYKKWRKYVIERDRHCQVCGKDSALHVDHVLPFADIIRMHHIGTVQDAKRCNQLWVVDNGRVLCEDCHRRTETYGSKKKVLDMTVDISHTRQS